uniref:Uncharacterized protein n=1 Tax=Physcomitrium patens TaxID=3218 RepID=A0A7I4E4A3_PHYPA
MWFQFLLLTFEDDFIAQGISHVWSAAARAAKLQRQRLLSTQPAKYLKENADTTKMSSAEAAHLGAAKRPPGSNPGTFMHQQSNLATKNNKFLQPWLLPIYPMAGMVAIGLGLAVMTGYRELVVNPGVLIDKTKRTDELPELHEQEWTMKMSRQYAEGSPLRNISTHAKISPFGRHLDEDMSESPAIQIGQKAMELSGEPPVLPGDDNPVHGPGGNKMVHGRPLGGNN